MEVIAIFVPHVWPVFCRSQMEMDPTGPLSNRHGKTCQTDDTNRDTLIESEKPT